MSDKEKLANIKRIWREENTFITDDIDFLIQQAEEKKRLEARVKELENLLFGSKAMADEGVRVIEGLRKQNKRYKQALEFYADRDNYKLEHFDPNLDDYMSTVDYDEGKTARKALEDKE